MSGLEGVALFPTPLFIQRSGDPQLAADLTREVLRERERDAGIQVSNCGGAWHSTPDLARRDGQVWQQAARTFVEGARAAFEQVARGGGHEVGAPFSTALQMWAMVTSAGGYSALHEHHGVGWSAVMYTDAGDDETERGGAIVFVDPRKVPGQSGGIALYQSAFTIKPHTGMLLVFPGWLQHYTHPYTGARPRVCVSANVNFSPTA